MDKDNKNTMSDSIKTLIQDTIQALHDKPIANGVLPTLAGTGISFIHSIEVGLRIASVSVALAIGCITLYVKWGDAVKVYNKRKENKKVK